MKMQIPLAALGFALVAGAPAANAQTVITREIVAQPVETVRTIETIRTVRPAARIVHRRVVTRETIVRERVVPGRAVVARNATYPQPLYDYAGSAPIVTNTTFARPIYDEVVPAPAPLYRRPLYDTVVAAPVSVAAPAEVVDETAIAPAPVGTAYSFYRYVYEP